VAEEDLLGEQRLIKKTKKPREDGIPLGGNASSLGDGREKTSATDPSLTRGLASEGTPTERAPTGFKGGRGEGFVRKELLRLCQRGGGYYSVVSKF